MVKKRLLSFFILLGIIMIMPVCIKQVKGIMIMERLERLSIDNANLDSESLLAIGEKMPFWGAELQDIERVKGISTVLGSRILKKKSELLEQGRYDKRALLDIKGIGKKRLEQIEKYFTFETVR